MPHYTRYTLCGGYCIPHIMLCMHPQYQPVCSVCVLLCILHVYTFACISTVHAYKYYVYVSLYMYINMQLCIPYYTMCVILYLRIINYTYTVCTVCTVCTYSILYTTYHILLQPLLMYIKFY